MIAAVFGGSFFFCLGLAAGWYHARGDRLAQPFASEGFVGPSEEEEKSLGDAFARLRAGDGPGALEALRTLRLRNPRLSSLSYVAALAATQAGDIAAATKETARSLAAGERVSDSYALAAAVESLKPGSVEWQSMGDPRERGDFFLRQAIAADLANAAPRLELGMRLRGKGENARAAEMLESARLRLHPVDPAAAVETTLLLIKLEGTEDGKLPADLDPDKNTASLIGAAYVALRQGDVSTAATLLGKAKSRLAPELHFYLLGDPAFTPYRQSPALSPLFQQ